jgi:glycosyltransferase involved in cell wall biosynthesis
MRVVYYNDTCDEGLSDADDLLARYGTLGGWCDPIRAAGVRISVVQRFVRDLTLMRNAVEYRFVEDSGRFEPWRRSKKVLRAIAASAPDVVHVNAKVWLLPWLRRYLPRDVAIVWQYHGGDAPKGFKRTVAKYSFQAADGVLFTADAQAQTYRRSGIFNGTTRVYEIPENSTRMSPMDYAQARCLTGIDAKPAFLWVGRLDDLKDPLTVIDAFKQIAPEFPHARLYMAYPSGELTDEVKMKIRSYRVENRVILLGRIDHERLIAYYSAADYFIAASRRESSGYALLEALACGCMPIVSNIPSFARFCGDGKIGELWNTGDLYDLARAIRKATAYPVNRTEVLEHFQKHLSPTALAQTAIAIYQSVTKKRTGVLFPIAENHAEGSFTVTAVQDENIQSALAILPTAVETSQAEEVYRWKLRVGDAIKFPAFCALDNSANIIGHYAATFTQIHLHGNEWPVVHAHDALTVSAYRHRGVMTAIMQKAHCAWKLDGVRLVLGLPNQHWRKDNRHHWQKIQRAAWFVCPLRISNYFRTRSLVIRTLTPVIDFVSWIYSTWHYPWTHGLKFENIDVSSPELETVWQSVKNKYGAIIVRNGDWLQYRYGQAPHRKYRFVIARHENRPVGYLVYAIHHERRYADLADVLTAPDDFRTKAALIRYALNAMRKDGASLCRALLNEHRPTRRALISNGFIKRQRGFDISVIPLDDISIRDLSDPETAFFIGGDFDVV